MLQMEVYLAICANRETVYIMEAPSEQMSGWQIEKVGIGLA